MEFLTEFSLTWLEWQMRLMCLALLLVGLAYHTFFRSPVIQSTIMRTGSLSLLALPALSFILPRLELAIMPAFITDQVHSNGWVMAIFGIAIMLCMFALGRFAVSISALIKLDQSTTENSVDDDISNECLQTLDIDKNINRFISKQCSVPFTYGILNHRILLPSNFSEWTKDHKRHVLLHEYLHVKQLDWAAQIGTMIVCAISSLNPILQKYKQLMMFSIEESVDRQCVYAGVDPR